MTTSKKFLVMSTLTGTDREAILKQTADLKPPVPNSETPEYAAFLQDFCDSPANVMSTIFEFMRTQADWNIDADKNYQAYLDSFNGAPFNVGVASRVNNTSLSVHTVSDLVEDIYVEARVPTTRRSSSVGLEDWLSGDFEDDPKTLQIIVQNLQSTDGVMTLLASNQTMTISYFPPERIGHLSRKKKELPTYKLEATGPIVTVSLIGASYFKDNGAKFLGLGLTNVTDWEEKTSTPVQDPK